MSKNIYDTKIMLIVPCYNEERRLNGEEFLSFIKTNPNISFLFIDDGSDDNTLEILRTIVSDGKDQARVVRLEKNCGKAEAVRQGINVAISNNSGFLGYWDADLATPLSEIHRFLSCFSINERLAFVCGSRIRRMGANIERYCYRHYMGRVVATFISIILGLPTYDTQCGAKLFTREIAKEIFEKPFKSTWLFDVELIARIVQSVGNEQARRVIYELPLHTWKDVGGSKINPFYLIKVPLELTRIFCSYKEKMK